MVRIPEWGRKGVSYELPKIFITGENQIPMENLVNE
jgi:hypothetical protein